MPISAFLITLNEEERIASALDLLKWTDEQIVVDGGSADRTCAIATDKGAKVYRRPFDNFENQKNYALSLARHEWVLSVDADESVPPALGQEIQNTIASPGALDGYYLKRVNYFLGTPLRFGGQNNERVLRLFRKSRGTFHGIVHEEVSISGPVGNLKNVLIHKSTATLSDYYRKLHAYTDLESNRMVAEGRIPSVLKTVFFPPGKWLVNYIFRGGFLDGRSGFFYHGLSCYYGWLKNFKARAINQKNREVSLGAHRH